MTTLAVTRALTAQTNPTEANFDTMRTELLNFFNAASLDETNVAAGGMLYSSLGDAADNTTLKFTSSHATLSYVSASDYFKIINTEGDIVWGLRTGSTLSDSMRLDKDTGDLTIGGNLYMNTSVGSQAVSVMWMLSRYRKPRLEYTSNDIVTAEDNSDVTGTVVIAGRDRFWTLYDTTCSLAVDANGETAADAGTAVSGLGAGVVRTANRWYFVYAVEVQYGTQNSGAYCILVANELAPTTANIASLDTAFTAGKWVYMGCIRNGYNDGTNTNIIVPFVMDECGYVRFYSTTISEEGQGVTMASQTNIIDLSYTIVIGNAAAATCPAVASRIIFGGHRSANGCEMHYREIATDENHMITGGCYRITDAALIPTIVFEVPLSASYKIVLVTGSASTDHRIVISGFLDHYV